MGEDSKPVVLLNRAAGAGGANRLSAVLEALRDAGVDADVQQVKPDELQAAARRAIERGVRVIVAAGGDGTVGQIASAVVQAPGGTVLGVLPAGTLNHFARDLGLPPDLGGAARVLAAGRVREVDVGEVNGRVFLNNCSIGLYPRMVIRRDQQRERLGRGKWFAMLLAFVSLFRRYPRVRVTLDGDGIGAGEPLRCDTPLVFVGNNRYETNLLNVGRRARLDGGELWVYLLDAPTRVKLLWLVLRGIVGRLRNARDFRSFASRGPTIDSRKRRVRIATDGEVTRVRPPLVFRIRPKALRVIGP